MLLMIGLPQDPVLHYFANYLKQRQRSMVFINQQRLGVDIELHSHALVLPNQWRIPFAEISGVFNRAVARLDRADFSSLQRAANVWLHGLLDEGWQRVVNRPKHMLSNAAKPYQLQCLRGTALKIPESWMLANSQLPAAWLGKVIYKSISNVRSIVQPVVSAEYAVVEPVLFQTKLVGVNIRVHVVGRQLFACQIQSDQLDYRYATTPNQLTPCKLPAAIAESCQLLTERLNLSFAGIDLIRTEVGQYFVLEVNPCPGYRYFESAWQDQPISEALWRHLVGVSQL